MDNENIFDNLNILFEKENNTYEKFINNLNCVMQKCNPLNNNKNIESLTHKFYAQIPVLPKQNYFVKKYIK